MLQSTLTILQLLRYLITSSGNLDKSDAVYSIQYLEYCMLQLSYILLVAEYIPVINKYSMNDVSDNLNQKNCGKEQHIMYSVS